MKIHTSFYQYKYKTPTTPGQRFQRRIFKKKGLDVYNSNKFIIPILKSSGRNNTGKITTFHRGGGHKKTQRLVDFKSNHTGYAKLIHYEYDSSRTSSIGLFLFNSGQLVYRLLPTCAQVGKRIMISNQMIRYKKLKAGDNVPMLCIPKREIVHSIELYFKKGSQFIRSAGTKSQILKKFNNGYVLIKLRTKELRFIDGRCKAAIGQVSNPWHRSIVVGKAGISRWMNRRPVVRGVAMNPIDHPHGGGQGKSKGGKPAVSPWGQPAKGLKTRKGVNMFIHRTRNAT